VSPSPPREFPGYRSGDRTHYAPYSAFDVPADLRELHGRWDVEAVAQRIRNYRYAEEWSMRILGGWVATIPELPVKTGLGKILWDCAQSADALGARLPELRFARNPRTTALASNPKFQALIEAIAEPEAPDLSIEKLVGIFEVLFPHLVEVYEHNILHTDAIADAPSIELLEIIAGRHRRHMKWADEVLAEVAKSPEGQVRRRKRWETLSAAMRNSGGVTGDWQFGNDANAGVEQRRTGG